MAQPAALEALAKKRQAELWDSTLALLESAVREDEAQRPRAACLIYAEALDGLMQLLQFETDASELRTALQERIDKYSRRLHDLRAALASGAALGDAAAAAPGPVEPQVPIGQVPIGQVVIERKMSSDGDAAAQARRCAERALQLERSGDPAKELDALTAAAEQMLSAIRLSKEAAATAALREELRELLERAEALKSARSSATPTATAAAAAAAAPMTTPGGAAAAASAGVTSAGSASGRAASGGAVSGGAASGDAAPGARALALTAEEKDVLARTSRIDGCLFYPWLCDATHERFRFERPWEDPDGLLTLNREQKAHFGGWARPAHFMRAPKMIELVSALSIVQTVITDCSFISSLVIAANYERKFGRQLVTAILFPQDALGVPVYNPSGKYLVKLKFNGVERRVAVDDRLPLSKDGRLLCSHSAHPEELWVSIIEKAFMKLHGGYDFPGSNSAIDMHALTGWVPEQQRTDDDDFKPQRLWERLVSASRHGDCLITVATGEMSDAEGERLGLVPTHAYAVLQVRELASGLKLLQLKNPWSRVRWRGAFSVGDTSSWTPALRAALHYDQIGATHHDNGIFWIKYSDVLRHFPGVYMNWKPQLFAFHTALHAQWPARAAATKETATLGRNPQLSLSLATPAAACGPTVWVLLSRHRVSSRAQKDAKKDARKDAQKDTQKDAQKEPFSTLHASRARSGSRVYYMESCEERGVYSDRPHSLLKLDVPAGVQKLTLVPAMLEPRRIDFTLDVFCDARFGLKWLPYELSHTQSLTAGWRAASAGGCPNFDSYVDNPCFAVCLGSEAPLLLELESADERFSVGLEVRREVRRQEGEGVTEGATEGATARLRTGDYRRGFCVLEAAQLAAGTYLVTASTFEPGQEGGFTLRVGSSSPIAPVQQRPHEAHALLRKVVRGRWEGACAAGCANHGRYHANPQLRLKLLRDSELLLRLCIPEGRSEGRSRPPLCLALFSGAARRDAAAECRHSQALALSGKGTYEYPPGGAVIPRRALAAGEYVLILSTFDPYEGPFELVVAAREGAFSIEGPI